MARVETAGSRPAEAAMSDCAASESMKALKLIRSERDYDRALAEVEELWGAKGGTPKADRLDILATLIEAYESEHYPMDPPDPSEATIRGAKTA